MAKLQIVLNYWLCSTFYTVLHLHSDHNKRDKVRLFNQLCYFIHIIPHYCYTISYIFIGVLGFWGFGAIVVVLGSTLYEISSRSSQNPFYRSPSATILEAYYLGHGSWEGVNSLFSPGSNEQSRLTSDEWHRAILVDQYNLVIMYYGQPYPAVPISDVHMPPQINQMPLFVKGQQVGTLIFDNRDLPHPVRLAVDVLNPILWISLVCAFITLFIGILLMSRIVNPLSEVIVAAEKVSSGDFKTRIKVTKSQMISDLSSNTLII